jgi:hypothetical protein
MAGQKVVENSRYETVLSSNREKARILQTPAACIVQAGEHRHKFGAVVTVAFATVKHMSLCKEQNVQGRLVLLSTYFALTWFEDSTDDATG